VRTLFLCVLLVASVGASAQSSLSAKKKELQRLSESIKNTQKKLDDLAAVERTKKRSLSTYQRQRHRVSAFIVELEHELSALQDSAQVLTTQIEETRASLQVAEGAYSSASQKLIRWRSENSGVPQANVSRDAMFRQLSSSLSTYRAEMLELRDSLVAQEHVLQEYSYTQQQVLGAKEHEQRLLSANINKSSKELSRIRSNKSELSQQLQEKQRSASRLRNLINDLVAQEMKQRQKKKSARPGIKTPEPKVSGFPRKSLPWPTTSHAILQGYGAYRNPTTGTTLENPGIDIAATAGSSVQCVAKGAVSSVTFLPGLGSLVIVDHGNGVRTVYANLSSVSVGKGAKVDQGSRIGSSGENIDGQLLHFEVWNGRERQNPTLYLR